MPRGRWWVQRRLLVLGVVGFAACGTPRLSDDTAWLRTDLYFRDLVSIGDDVVGAETDQQGSNQLVRLRGASGERQWAMDLAPLSGPPVFVRNLDGLPLFWIQSGVQVRVFSLDPDDGTVAERHSGALPAGSSDVHVTDQRVAANLCMEGPGASCHVEVSTTDGVLLRKTPEGPEAQHPVLAVDGDLIVYTWSGLVSRYTASGELAWTLSVDVQLTDAGIMYMSNGDIVTLIHHSYTAWTLTRLARDQTPRWSTELSADSYSFSLMVGDGTDILLGGYRARPDRDNASAFALVDGETGAVTREESLLPSIQNMALGSRIFVSAPPWLIAADR